MATIVVTGGAGFIGCNFVRQALVETDDRIVVFDKLTYAGNLINLPAVGAAGERLQFVRGDVAEGEQVRALFAEHRPRWVVHFAAESHVDRSIDDPEIFVRTNVLGTFELLEAARLYWQRQSDVVRSSFRFLQVSTDEVYGSLVGEELFSESSAYAPNSPYSATKAAADHLVRAYHHTYGLPTLSTHCADNFGPYQFPEKLIPLMLMNALEGRPLPIYGDGRHVRDWLFVADHCGALLRVLRAGRVGEKYNVGAGNQLANVDVVDRLCRILDEVIPAHDNPALHGRGLGSYLDLKTFVADRPGHDRRYAVDATKLRHELGWAPQQGFDAALRATVDWYLGNRAWCEAVSAGRYQRERLGLVTAVENMDRRGGA